MQELSYGRIWATSSAVIRFPKIRLSAPQVNRQLAARAAARRRRPTTPKINSRISPCNRPAAVREAKGGRKTKPANGSTHGLGEVQPLTSGGGGGNTGSTGSVSGEVWLDNNGDGIIDDGELGYSGITVKLETEQGICVVHHNRQQRRLPVHCLEFKHHAPILYGPSRHPPTGDRATIEGLDSDINSGGYTPVFALTVGGAVQKTGGIRSMNVTTLQDTPTAPFRIR